MTSRVSFCLMEGKPPLLQESMWSIVKLLSHAQVLGTLSGCQLYLKARASRNADLWREKPNSEIGRVVSQLEAPFSWARDMVRCKVCGRDDLMFEAISLCNWCLE